MPNLSKTFLAALIALPFCCPAARIESLPEEQHEQRGGDITFVDEDGSGFLEIGGNASDKPKRRRFFSIADLHGDLPRTVKILTFMRLIKKEGNNKYVWTGGDSVLVQTGDIVDRGEGSAGIYKLFFSLREQAPKSGGKVVMMLGNHELLNMKGDHRYMLTKEFGTYGGIDRVDEIFKPNGLLGKRLVELPLVYRMGPDVGLSPAVLFVHAGLMYKTLQAFREGTDDPEEIIARLNAEGRRLLLGLGGDADAAFVQEESRVEGLREAGREPEDEDDDSAVTAEEAGADDDGDELVAYDEDEEDALLELSSEGEPRLLSGTGPLWTRELVRTEACDDLAKTLKKLGAARMIVGHTIQQGGKVRQKCEGRFVMADTAISKGCKGGPNPSFVEVKQNGEAQAIYPDLKQKHVLKVVASPP